MHIFTHLKAWPNLQPENKFPLGYIRDGIYLWWLLARCFSVKVLHRIEKKTSPISLVRNISHKKTLGSDFKLGDLWPSWLHPFTGSCTFQLQCKYDKSHQMKRHSIYNNRLTDLLIWPTLKQKTINLIAPALLFFQNLLSMRAFPCRFPPISAGSSNNFLRWNFCPICICPLQYLAGGQLFCLQEDKPFHFSKLQETFVCHRNGSSQFLKKVLNCQSQTFVLYLLVLLKSPSHIFDFLKQRNS